MLLSAIIFLILAILSVIQMVLSERERIMDTQTSSVEAGFEKVWFTSFMASPFFFMAALFVLFDVELVLLLPLILYSKINMTIILSFVSLLLVIVGTLGLEWIWAGLKWNL